MSDDPVVGAACGADPTTVESLSELATAFQRLRGTRSYAELDKAVNSNHRGGARMLPASTLNNLLHAKSVPTRETVVMFLAACGLDEPAQVPWLAAWERVSTAHHRRWPDAVRVRLARPRLLGVHASIQVEGSIGELPEYVPRDLDTELRTAITAAARYGGFILLVGSSSVGKTRSLYEAVRAVLPEWWLIHPTDARAVSEFAATPTPRTVIWLDELQRYLNASQDHLSGGVARSLIAAGAVFLATLWPDEYGARTTSSSRAPGSNHPHVDDRQLLGLARVIDVPGDLSSGELRRAELATDPRIRVALGTRDTGFTQVLAAGPDLVRRWDNASDPYGKAIITAALDVRRGGFRSPAPRELLAAATPSYLTAAQRAAAPPDWLDQALSYACTYLYDAAAPLTAVGGGMGQVAGYVVADYLYQHALAVREGVQLPDAVWLAMIDHHDRNDTISLARNARISGRISFAQDLYRIAAEGGNSRAAVRLVGLLLEQGRIEDAESSMERYSANYDGRTPFGTWVYLLERDGRKDAATNLVKRRLIAANMTATRSLVDLLVRYSCFEELHALANGGNAMAAYELAYMSAEGYGQSRPDEAIAMLRPFVAAGEWCAITLTTELLVDQGRIKDAISILIPLVDAGDEDAIKHRESLLSPDRKPWIDRHTMLPSLLTE